MTPYDTGQRTFSSACGRPAHPPEFESDSLCEDCSDSPNLHLLHSEPRSTKVLHLIPANTEFLLWTKPWEFRGSQAPSRPLTPRPSARRTELDPSDTRGLHNLSCLGRGARERMSGGLGWSLREVGDKTGLWGKLSCKRQNKDNKLGPDCEDV